MGTATREPAKVMKTSIDRGDSVKGKKRARAFIAALLLSAVAALALAGVASAHLVYPYEFEKSFKGTDSTAGAMTTAVHGLTINQANGNVYVLDEHNGHSDISQF